MAELNKYIGWMLDQIRSYGSHWTLELRGLKEGPRRTKA